MDAEPKLVPVTDPQMVSRSPDGWLRLMLPPGTYRIIEGKVYAELKAAPVAEPDLTDHFTQRFMVTR